MSITTRLSKAVSTQCRNSFLLYARRKQQQQNHYLPIFINQFHSLRDHPQKKVVAQSHHSVFNVSAFQRYGISSSASSQPNEKETSADVNGDAEVSDKKNESDMAFEDLSRDDLVKLALEKEEILKVKDEEFHQMKDKYIRAYAEIENVMARTKREAENSKKYAIQNFAKSLLDVADNLGRAASVVKESFSKIDESKDTAGAVPLLKTLLEGVEMTDKQLAEVFKKAGIEKSDPVNEQFDPNKHNAVFQVPDPSKPPGTIAVVLKAGYSLHDRIIRPAEVGVTVAVENE